MNGCRVDPAATWLTRISSTRPVTETSDESFSATCQRLPSPGIAKRSTCGAIMRRKMRKPLMPTLRAASSSPRAMARYAPRNTEEALEAERMAQTSEQPRTAEIDEIDDEQFRQAAKQRRVALTDRTGN